MSLISSVWSFMFFLGVRMSLSVEGAGHMPRRCAATMIFRKMVFSSDQLLYRFLTLTRFCLISRNSFMLNFLQVSGIQPNPIELNAFSGENVYFAR